MTNQADSTGGGSTNWNAYGLDALWSMVAQETGAVSLQQTDAWRRAGELCDDQADQLARALNELQQRWPAHPGSASETFGAVVGQLVSSMHQSAVDSRANRDAIGAISVEIRSARTQLAEIVSDYNTYTDAERVLADQPFRYADDVNLPSKLPDDPPPNWRNKLTNEARQVMANMDTNVLQQVPKIQATTTIDPIREAKTTPIDPGGPGSRGGIPHIPLPAFDPPPTLPGVPLGQSARGPAPDRPPSAENTWPNPGTLLDGAEGPAVAPGNGGRPDSMGSWPNGVDSKWGTIGGIAGTVHASGMPTIIGNPATAGMVPQETNAVRSPGGGLAPGSGIKAGPAPGSPMMAPPVGAMGQRGGGGTVAPGGRVPGYRDRNRRRDPNDPWAPREGTPAVIEPSAADIDDSPGPGVLGIDR